MSAYLLFRSDSIMIQITDEDVRISEEQLKELGEAIKVLSSKSAAEIERAELERLRIEREEYKGVCFRFSILNILLPLLDDNFSNQQIWNPLATGHL